MVVVRPGMVVVVLLLLPVGPEHVTERGLLVVVGPGLPLSYQTLPNASSYVLVTAPLH